MKKILLLLIAFLLSFGANGQFETNLNGNYNNFLRTLQGEYAMIINERVGIALDENGELFNTLAANDPVGGYFALIDLADTSVIYSHAGFWLEPFGWFGLISTTKFDKNWMPHPFEGSYFEGSKGEKTVDGGYILYRKFENSISKNDSFGHEDWGISDDSSSILDVATDSLFNTIAAIEQGIWIIDSSGQTDTLITSHKFTNIETISFGNLVGAKADTIYLFDSNFEVINKAPMPGQIVKDMKSMEGKVAVLTESNHVYLYDQNLLPISDFQLDYDHLTFINIVPDQDGIVLAGDHHYGVYPAGNAAIFIKKFSVDGFDPFERRDIGLQFIQPATQTEVWPEGGKFKVRFHDVKFQVINYSDTVLTSFRVNVRFPDLPMEWPLVPSPVPQHFSKQFNNLNLGPGQSTTLTWEEFTATFVDYPSGSNLELCFWSSMPDGKSDINSSNDVACGDFFVNDEETILPRTFFEIYPNPTSTSCTLSFNPISVFDNEVRIYDAFGRLTQVHPLNIGDTQLQIDELAVGPNFVVLLSAGRLVESQIVIKQGH